MNRQIAHFILLFAVGSSMPGWGGPTAIFLAEEVLVQQLRQHSPLPDASERQYFLLLRGQETDLPTQARLGVTTAQGPGPVDSEITTLTAPSPDRSALVRTGTTGIADLDNLIETTLRMVELAAFHRTLRQVHEGEVQMKTSGLLEHWIELQNASAPDPYFLEKNRAALLTLFVDRYAGWAERTFESFAQAHTGVEPPQRGWFLAAIDEIHPDSGSWSQVWNSAPGEFSDRSSPRAVARRAFLAAQDKIVQDMAAKYLDRYLAQEIQDFDCVFPILDRSLRAEPYQQQLFDWLLARATKPEQLASLLEIELWDAAFLRFAGAIQDDHADPTLRSTRENSEKDGKWNFPEEMLFGEVFLRLLQKAETGLGITAEKFLAQVFDRLLGGKPPRSLNFMLETYIFQLEKLIEKKRLPASSHGVLETHLKAITHELFLRASQAEGETIPWYRSVAEFAMSPLQEITVLSRGWYPPTPKGMAEIFELSTAPGTDPYIRIAARSALASFVPLLVETSLETLQSGLSDNGENAAFVEQMRSCVNQIAAAADQAKKLGN